MYASVDIGTNTALLLVAEPSEEGLEIIREEQRVPRLGQGTDRAGKLGREAEVRVIEALLEYRAIIEQEYPGVKKTVVTATSAVRDAGNRQAFLERVKSETGWAVRVLSGPEEAQYTFRGAQSVLPLDKRPVVIVDIGGGSTELAYGQGGVLIDRHSFDMGCVRYTERYLKGDPPSRESVERCRSVAAALLDEHLFSFSEDTLLLGVAGTVTSLAYMQRDLDSYHSTRLNGQRLELAVLKEWIHYVGSKKAETLVEAYPEVMEGRADIFLAGLLILERVMEAYGFGQLTVSTGGIRHGAILELADL